MFFIKNLSVCANGTQAIELQKYDEIETTKFGHHLSFVPYIFINGKSHLHMQAMQTIMTEKIRSWKMTLLRNPLPHTFTKKVLTNCQIPPDFWCTDSTITMECYTSSGCTNYLRLIYGKPIRIRVLYQGGADSWQKYFNEYLNPNLIKSDRFSRDNKGKFVLELEPIGNTIELDCDQNCQQRVAFEVLFCLFLQIKI